MIPRPQISTLFPYTTLFRSSGVSSANALLVSGSDLYVGGGFTNAGGVPASHIAKWDGSNWSALGGGLDNTVFADRKSTRLNSSHSSISYAVFCLKKKR